MGFNLRDAFSPQFSVPTMWRNYTLDIKTFSMCENDRTSSITVPGMVGLRFHAQPPGDEKFGVWCTELLLDTIAFYFQLSVLLLHMYPS